MAEPLINLVICDVKQNDVWDQFQVMEAELPKMLLLL